MKSLISPTSAVIGLCCLIAVLEVSSQEDGYLKVPTQVGSFGNGAPVYGFHRIKDNFYLARDSTPHIEVYNAIEGNDPQPDLPVTGLQGPYDLVGTVDNRKLFITDWFDASNITVANLKGQKEVTRFSIGEPFTVVGLGATVGDTNVIVTCAQTRKIKEFTSAGVLVRAVTIPEEIPQPRHSIKVKGGYLMCHGYGSDQKHRVCRLNDKGEVVKCFGSDSGAGKDKLDVPSRILVDEMGNVLVADRNNKRVVLLNAKLEYVRDLVTSAHGLKGPTRMFLDGPTLYVADNVIENEIAVNGRVCVFRVKNT